MTTASNGAAAHPGAGEGLPPRQRRLALLAVTGAIALSAVSITSVSLALPVMARELDLAPATAVQLVSVFQLALLATLFPFAALGEQWGYARTFALGLLTIALASLVCALSDSFGWLLAGRILQGLGASAVMAVNPALMRLSTSPGGLGRVLGINAMVVALSTALGPSLGALALSLAGWRWLFGLNLPWAMAALAIGWSVLPRQVHASGRGFDTVGALLNIATFVLAAAALERVSGAGPAAAGLLVGAVACGGLLYAHQRHRPAPMVPLDLLRIPRVGACAGASVFAFASQLAMLVALPFLFHEGLRLSLMTTGLALMACPLAVAAMAPVAGWWLDRGVPSSRLCVLGSALQCMALLLMACMPGTLGFARLVLLMVVVGIGFGLFQTPNNRTMLGATPRERSGGAGGIQATARLAGQTLGAAVVGLFFRLLPGDALAACSAALTAAAAFAAVSACFSLQRRKDQSAA